MAYLPVLFRIQEIYNRQRILEKSTKEIERRPDLIELRNRKEDYAKKLVTIKKKQGLIRKSLHQLDLDLKSCLAKIEQEETKLYSGSVTNSRELEQIQLKVLEYNNTKSKLEENSYQLLEEEEKLITLKERIEKLLQSLDGQMTIIEAEIGAKIFELNLESTELNGELEELIPKIPREWLERLEKIAGSHNGIGIAQIKSGCCGACHVSLSEFLLQRAKRGEDQLLLCETCGRIIFY